MCARPKGVHAGMRGLVGAQRGSMPWEKKEIGRGTAWEVTGGHIRTHT